MVSLLADIAVAALLATIYRYIVYPAFLSPLAKIPAAHFSAHFSSLWLKYIRYHNIENRTVQALHEKYGPIVRLGPSELSINCYDEGLKTVYGGGFPKTTWYPLQFAFYGFTNMFTTIDSHAHSVRKRMVSNMYSKSSILASPNLRATTTAILHTRLLPLLASMAVSPIDILPLAHAYTMDSFTAFHFYLTEAPRVTAWLRRWLGVHLVPAAVTNGFQELEAWNLQKCDEAAKAIAASKTDDEDAPVVFGTMLAQFRKLHGGECWGSAADGEGAQRRRLEIASDMFDHNVAAMETSGLTLTWALYELSRRPALQARLRRELLTLRPPVSALDAAAALPDPKTLDALPLLDAVLQETLRLWPAVAGRQPRCTPPGPPCTLAGHADIPPGVAVQAYAYSLHRNGEVFPAPEEWLPERWMEAEPARLAEMRRWLWAFGSGGRADQAFRRGYLH
ncbi:putative cytochrome p450 protein [Neofusicoccum parvum UCRNP2]|uniref:Putative cytochrome p450 protein n=1 Tax=Botryosphaeria parva (strain UCR-NP2) TaxID=1287680 RepID=R1EAW0_BOTPV|nr:putative cytochrome p450 protein [Neofusicoccum parvum UCRNP2]